MTSNTLELDLFALYIRLLYLMHWKLDHAHFGPPPIASRTLACTTFWTLDGIRMR